MSDFKEKETKAQGSNLPMVTQNSAFPLHHRVALRHS